MVFSVSSCRLHFRSRWCYSRHLLGIMLLPLVGKPYVCHVEKQTGNTRPQPAEVGAHFSTHGDLRSCAVQLSVFIRGQVASMCIPFCDTLNSLYIIRIHYFLLFKIFKLWFLPLVLKVISEAVLHTKYHLFIDLQDLTFLFSRQLTSTKCEL